MSAGALPAREIPDPTTKRGKLVANARDALASLPAHFTSKTYIEGLEAGDLFSLNSMLGGSIEIQVVETLNRLRPVWDPDSEWEEYTFVRSAQTFPDVRLTTHSSQLIAKGEQFAMGIELKGWYLLSREGEPSFRYTVTRNVCDVHDLLVVVPWHLKNILSGEPIVYKPFVESARYAADMRNHYWTVGRKAKDEDKGKPHAADYYAVTSPAAAAPYPPPKTKISDEAAKDGGKNFGRVARAEGLMDDYVDESLATAVAGIEARHWVAFFKTYAETAERDELHLKIAQKLARDRLAHSVEDDLAALLQEWIARLPLERESTNPKPAKAVPAKTRRRN